MKKVYSATDSLMIGHIKNVLETHGMDCVVKNMYLAAAAGEIPPIECWPELWVVDDARYGEAQTVLKGLLAPVEGLKEPWKCAQCGEEVEGQFSECWNCSSRQP